ncbi:tetratricopeptide repeat protein [Saccharothrix sp. NRRL B-16348]|uniref:tetratricopeptide repeat protein n=1 Tax=Saccharothrix sp. NRRL B-16348 TaxID=1415542 RepID=UPI0012FC143A|nr:tetratricopeptide repeat protein [Saccharothrix sp. NRRL B-16348]
MVAWIIRGSFADAHDVLERLTAAGRATRTDGGTDYRIRRTRHPGPTDDLFDPLLRHIHWFLTRALAADQAIHPHDRRPATCPTSTATHIFDSTIDATRWYTDNARHLRALLPLVLRLDHDLTWWLAQALWRLSRWTGDHSGAVEAQMIGLTAAQRSPTLPHRARLLTRADHLARAAISLTDTGRHQAALPLCDEAVTIATTAADPTVLSTALSARAHAKRAAGHTEQALADLFRSLEQADDDHSRALRHHSLATALTDLDRHDEALINLGHAATLMLAVGDDLGHARVNTTRADVLIRVGRPTEAAPLLNNALPVATRSGSPLHVADVQAALGHCAQATGDPDRAVEWFTAARTNYLAARHGGRADAMSAAIACCATTADPRPGSRDRQTADCRRVVRR